MFALLSSGLIVVFTFWTSHQLDGVALGNISTLVLQTLWIFSATWLAILSLIQCLESYSIDKWWTGFLTILFGSLSLLILKEAPHTEFLSAIALVAAIMAHKSSETLDAYG